VGEGKPEFNGDSVETARGIPVRIRKSAAAGEARLVDDDDIQSQQQQQQAAANENRTIRRRDSANKLAQTASVRPASDGAIGSRQRQIFCEAR